MGSISKYVTRNGDKRYRVQYRTPDHRSTTRRNFLTKKAATLFLASVDVKIGSGEWISPADARITVSALGGDWLAAQAHLKPSSLNVVETAWRVHVEPMWGARMVGQIRPSEVQDWVSQFSKRRSATVVIRANGVLAGLLDRALRDRRISHNPARGISLPRNGRKETRNYLGHVQLELLAEESGRYGTVVRLLAYTGLRWGEAVGLRVGSLDMLRRRILVKDNATNVAGKIIAGTPKGHESRSVPFPEFLVEDIARACEGKARDALVFGDGLSFMPTPTHGNGWFAGARGRALEQDDDFPVSLTIHDLRHTAASLAISAGANVKAVQRMLGHASAAMTLDTYADLFDDDLDAVAVALADARAKALAVGMQSRG